MKKTLILFISLFLLAACDGGNAVADAVPTQSMPPTFTPGPISCTVVLQDLIKAEIPITEIKPGEWTRGAEDAYVTIIQYADFQMEFYAALAATFVQLQTEFPEDIRIIFRHYPLYGPVETPWYDKTFLAVQAAEAAGMQGKFWEMHDLLYSTQSDWTTLPPESFPLWAADQAIRLGLDGDLFIENMLDENAAQFAFDNWKYGLEVGLPYDHALIVINGAVYTGPMGYDSLKTIIQLTLLERLQFNECPPQVIDPDKQYLATLHTAKGDILIELFPQAAPFTVNNFVFLTENGWYDNTSFHRVIEGLIAQGGDPTGTGVGTPGYFFGLEVNAGLRFNRPGLLAMANAGADANGSQFFITMDAYPAWDGGYTIFGEVLDGMDVVASLTVRETGSGTTPLDGDILYSITIEERETP